MRGLKRIISECNKKRRKSHLLQMRGLKHTKDVDNQTRYVASFTDAWIETFIYIVCEDSMESHLLQMRGLKLSYNKRVCKLHPSHLLQMRGLKQRGIINTLKSLTSHLLQMRGLKLCVVLNNNLLSHVASFTDAWIETIMARTAKALALSHLLQMRGLKHWG